MRSIIIVFVAFQGFTLILGENILFGKRPEFKWDNLKVKFGISLNPHANNFIPMPRTVDLSQEGVNNNGGWGSISLGDCTNGGSYNGFRFLYNEEPSICLLYDVNGIIAGMQMILNKREVLSSYNHFHYDKVPMFQNETINSHKVFTLTVYFVQPEIICNTGRTIYDLDTQGTGTGVYFQNGPTPSKLIIPPIIRSVAVAEGWTKGNCVPMMGWHNFYKSEQWANTDCLEILPVFLMYNKYEQLKGFGFITFGDDSSYRYRYEKPSPSTARDIIGDITPKCVLDLTNSIRVTSFHVWFINHPQHELCLPSLH